MKLKWLCVWLAYEYKALENTIKKTYFRKLHYKKSLKCFLSRILNKTTWESKIFLQYLNRERERERFCISFLKLIIIIKVK